MHHVGNSVQELEITGCSMTLLARIVLACSMLSLAQSACENMLGQDFAFYGGGSTKYSKSLVEQDFPNAKGPFKMIDDGDQGTSLTTVGDSVIKGLFGKGKISGKETGAPSASSSGFSWAFIRHMTLLGC